MKQQLIELLTMVAELQGDPNNSSHTVDKLGSWEVNKG